MKRCYYEILQVDRKVETAQIKKAYKRMALKYHPDKNFGDDAKKLFLQVQQAYEVLSDPNERTFYDSNREKILFNKEDMSKEDLELYSFGFNIWPYFTAKCFKGFGDQEGAFFQVYREVFQNIKGQEAKAYKIRQDDFQEQLRKFEGFGVSTTNMDKVVSFYEDWLSFSTYKSFTWIEQYDTREAQNRWVKRRMQEQNKKERLKQKKNYIKTIKDLVNFVKKRDPRFQQYVIIQKEEEQRKEKEQIRKAQEKKKQKENMKKTKQQIEEQRFKQIEEYHKKNSANQKQTNGEGYQQENEYLAFYCRICEKLFKSANQLENHELSKMHRHNVRTLQRQVMLAQQLLQEANKQKQEQLPVYGPHIQSKQARIRRLKKQQKLNNPTENNQNDNQDGNESKSSQPQDKSVSDQPSATKAKKDKNKNKKVESSSEEEEGPKLTNKQLKKLKFLQQQRQQQQKKLRQQQEEKRRLQEAANQPSEDQDIINSLSKHAKKKGQEYVDQDGKKVKKTKGKGNSKHGHDIEESQQQVQEPGEKKISKAKLKKMKKAEQQKNSGNRCRTCGFNFISKNALFDHLEQTDHAVQRK